MRSYLKDVERASLVERGLPWPRYYRVAGPHWLVPTGARGLPKPAGRPLAAAPPVSATARASWQGLEFLTAHSRTSWLQGEGRKRKPGCRASGNVVTFCACALLMSSLSHACHRLAATVPTDSEAHSPLYVLSAEHSQNSYLHHCLDITQATMTAKSEHLTKHAPCPSALAQRNMN